MQLIKHFFTSSIFILFAMTSFAQNNSSPLDRLGVKGPITFDNKVYDLSWSSHPTPTYYKQEYMVQGGNPNTFTSMLMVEAATGAMTPRDAMDAKVRELQSLHTTNPFI